MDYYIREDHLAEKRSVIAQQALILGVTAAKNHWLYRQVTIVREAYEQDSLGSDDLVDGDMVRVVERDGPSLEPLNIYYTFWDANAS
jgi:hypothetical protein